jgi:hypothetical protein
VVAVNDHSYEWPLSDPSVRNPSVRSMARRSSIEACHESLVGEVLDLAEVSLAQVLAAADAGQLHWVKCTSQSGL